MEPIFTAVIGLSGTVLLLGLFSLGYDNEPPEKTLPAYGAAIFITGIPQIYGGMQTIISAINDPIAIFIGSIAVLFGSACLAIGYILKSLLDPRPMALLAIWLGVVSAIAAVVFFKLGVLDLAVFFATLVPAFWLHTVGVHGKPNIMKIDGYLWLIVTAEIWIIFANHYYKFLY
jgi:hypothetical protein